MATGIGQPPLPPGPPAYGSIPPGSDSSYVVAAIAVAAAIVILGTLGFYALYVTVPAPPPSVPPPCCGEIALSGARAETPFNQSGTTYYPYVISIQSASSELTGFEIGFELETANGTTAPFAYIGLIDVSGCWVGSYSYGWGSGIPPAPAPGTAPCGSAGPTLSDQVSSGDELYLVTSSSISDEGYSLVVFDGVAPGGSVTVAIP
jgi:hypothetical protein